MKAVGAIVLAVIAFFVLLPLIKTVLGLLFGAINLALGLLYIAAIIGVVIFLVGLFRRLMRV